MPADHNPDYTYDVGPDRANPTAVRHQPESDRSSPRSSRRRRSAESTHRARGRTPDFGRISVRISPILATDPRIPPAQRGRPRPPAPTFDRPDRPDRRNPTPTEFRHLPTERPKSSAAYHCEGTPRLARSTDKRHVPRADPLISAPPRHTTAHPLPVRSITHTGSSVRVRSMPTEIQLRCNLAQSRIYEIVRDCILIESPSAYCGPGHCYQCA